MTQETIPHVDVVPPGTEETKPTRTAQDILDERTVAREKIHKLREELRAKVDVLERKEASDQKQLDVLQETLDLEQSFRALEGNKGYQALLKRIEQRMKDMAQSANPLQDVGYPNFAVYLDGWRDCLKAMRMDLGFFLGHESDHEKRVQALARRRDRVKVLKASLADNREMRFEAERALLASMSAALPAPAEGGE